MNLNLLEVYEMHLIPRPIEIRDLQCRLPMSYTAGWNIVCIHKIIPDVFSGGFLIFNVAHIIHHKQCS